MNARRMIRDKILHHVGVERSHKPRAIIENPEWAFDSFLPFVVSRQILKSKEFCFVQVGAYDGVSNDCLYTMATEYGLRGILLEPQRGAFARLEKNYAGCSHLDLLNAALSDVDGERDFYTTPACDTQLASFHKSHLQKYFDDQEIVVHKVPTFRLESLLKKHGLDHLDLLQIDAEGYDYEIIKTIDFDVVVPSIIRFERRHMSGQDQDECLGKLASHGYRFFVERRDLIAYNDRSDGCVRFAA